MEEGIPFTSRVWEITDKEALDKTKAEKDRKARMDEMARQAKIEEQVRRDRLDAQKREA